MPHKISSPIKANKINMAFSIVNYFRSIHYIREKECFLTVSAKTSKNIALYPNLRPYICSNINGMAKLLICMSSVFQCL